MPRNWPHPANAKVLADTLVKMLLQNDFTVQRYDAYSTDSIYLKLDYGVCNSIRISDHKGKKHLSYRYNIGFDIKAYYTKDDEYLRHFFPVSDYEKLIELCISDREDKLLRYGDRYNQYMEDSLVSNKFSRGFWEEARVAMLLGDEVIYE